MSAKREARVLYLRICVVDVNNPDLFTTHEEVRFVLDAWDLLRRYHSSAAPQGAQGKRRSFNKAVAKEPSSGSFAAVTTEEVRPRRMSKTEVDGILQRCEERQEPLYVSLPNKAKCTAAVSRDGALLRQLSPRSGLPPPSKYEIATAIPPQGITVRELLLQFASQLSVKTIANFLETAFIISAMDPVSKKVLPTMTYDQADALLEGDYRDTMIRATRSIKTLQNAGNPKYEAF